MNRTDLLRWAADRSDVPGSVIAQLLKLRVKDLGLLGPNDSVRLVTKSSGAAFLDSICRGGKRSDPAGSDEWRRGVAMRLAGRPRNSKIHFYVEIDGEYRRFSIHYSKIHQMWVDGVLPASGTLPLATFLDLDCFSNRVA